MRRNLVVVRAGDTSLHPTWLPASGQRNWDLIVSYFGDDPERYRVPDVSRIDGKGAKWSGLHAVLMANLDLIGRYDYIWLPDDDIACRSWDIDRLFDAMRRYNLLLAQPALSPASYFYWCITLRNPLTRVRWTDFVEIMVPCFHRDLLIKCLPTMEGRVAGGGLDWVWPKAAGPDPWRIAIIDQVSVTHTRPVGGPTYKLFEGRGFTAEDEMADIMRTYDIPNTVTRINGILTWGGLRLRGNSRLAGLLLRTGYWLIIVAAYASRNPKRWDLDKRLRKQFANPAVPTV